MRSEKEFVTMSVLKEMLKLQQKSFKATIDDGLKSEIREIRKEQEELKLSVKFCSGKYEDSKGRTFEYPTIQNVCPVSADTGYGSCILS